MRVILGLFSFADVGGTESYALTAARELERLGHSVVIATEEPGSMAELAERWGLRVARSPSEWPSTCDAVFAQDGIVTATLAERYAGTRLVYFAHSTIFDHHLPVLVPGVVSTVVAASDLVIRRIAALNLDVPIVRLRHPVDTERFTAGPIARSPRRALLLGNYLTGRRRQALVDAWEAAGITCRQIGNTAEPELDVVPAIAEADIVVAKSRAALEGMSCARAVYVYDEFGGDGWITPENYAACEANNFAGSATGGPRTPADLVRDLADYSPDMGWQNRELVLAHHSARRHAAELVAVLGDADGGHVHRTSALDEVARLTRTGWFSERRSLLLERGASTLREHVHAVEQERDLLREEQIALREEQERWQSRAYAAERDLIEARWLLGTRRARIGLTLGRAVDRLRARR